MPQAPYLQTTTTPAIATGSIPRVTGRPSCAEEAPEPLAVIGRHLLCRKSHFNTPNFGATASLRASIPGEPAAGSSSGLLQRRQRAGGLPIDCPSSSGCSAAASRPEGHALPARRRSCETLGRRRLHRVVPSDHATSGSRGPWQLEYRPHAEGAAAGPLGARPRAPRRFACHGEGEGQAAMQSSWEGQHQRTSWARDTGRISPGG